MIIMIKYLIVIIIIILFLKKKNNYIKPCRESTMNNPFGNYLLTSNPNLEACTDYDKVKNNFMINLYVNSSESIKRYLYDNYEKDNYMITPVTKYPNDQSLFANYLYNRNMPCKDNNICLRYRDLRYIR